jgi:class I fructose-bisphosphate aldolase
MINLDKILQDGKAIYLAYDHGMEHGPIEFDDAAEAIDPNYILKIAADGDYNGVILHKGTAEKYYSLLGADERKTLPLIVKLNGKTNIPDLEPYSSMICTVEEAIELGASAVGYTIYLGSEHESTMLWEFGRIVEDAHQAGIPAIAWVYPRGKWVKEKYESDTNPEIVAYGARVALELGADIAKIKYTGDRKSFAHVVKSAGRCKVVLSGGAKTDDPKEFLQVMKDVMAAGGAGVAVGRNVWKAKDPFKVTNDLKKIVFG